MRGRQRAISALVALFAMLILGACRPLPRENGLIDNFQNHRQGFETLLKMANTDAGFRRIPAGGLPPRGMRTARFQEYLNIFHQLNVENGLTRNLSPSAQGGVFVIARSIIPSLVGGGESVGYVYSQGPVTPVVEHLGIPMLPVGVPAGHGRRTEYKLLAEHWYLYFDLEW